MCGRSGTPANPFQLHFAATQATPVQNNFPFTCCNAAKIHNCTHRHIQPFVGVVCWCRLCTCGAVAGASGGMWRAVAGMYNNFKVSRPSSIETDDREHGKFCSRHARQQEQQAQLALATCRNAGRRAVATWPWPWQWQWQWDWQRLTPLVAASRRQWAVDSQATCHGKAHEVWHDS